MCVCEGKSWRRDGIRRTEVVKGAGSLAFLCFDGDTRAKEVVRGTEQRFGDCHHSAEATY